MVRDSVLFFKQFCFTAILWALSSTDYSTITFHDLDTYIGLGFLIPSFKNFSNLNNVTLITHLISSYVSIISHLTEVFIFFWIICHSFSAYHIAELRMTWEFPGGLSTMYWALSLLWLGGLIPGLATSSCCGHGQKKKKRMTKGSTVCKTCPIHKLLYFFYCFLSFFFRAAPASKWKFPG